MSMQFLALAMFHLGWVLWKGKCPVRLFATFKDTFDQTILRMQHLFWQFCTYATPVLTILSWQESSSWKYLEFSPLPKREGLVQVDLSISFETKTEWAEPKCTHTTRAEVGAGKSAKLVKIFNGQDIIRLWKLVARLRFTEHPPLGVMHHQKRWLRPSSTIPTSCTPNCVKKVKKLMNFYLPVFREAWR